VLYLKELERRRIEPNFWTSEEYIQKAGLQQVMEDGWLFIVEDGAVVLPPLPIGPQAPFDKKIWSDFHEHIPGHTPQFHREYFDGELDELDLEYIYDPLNFNHMDGAHWAVFRKNCRKWPNRNPGEIVYDRLTLSNDNPHGLFELIVSWLTGLEESGEEEIHDHEVLLKYLYNGLNRKALWLDGELMGVNIWDSNYKYINYRYCICRPDQPFLSEYLRWRFYTDRVIQLTRKQTGKLVNDGGVLDRPALKAFKDKMNPCRVRSVYTWTPPNHTEEK